MAGYGHVGPTWRVLMLVLLVAALAVSSERWALGAPTAQAVGATLTVLRGTVAVVRADGTAVSPAGTGLALGAGDRVATLTLSGALVTFFEGSELELGAGATIIIRDLGSQGARTNISIESVVGSTVHRVTTLSDPGSTYRVDSGGTVALVRGTVFGHRADPNGDVTVYLDPCDPPPGAPPRAAVECLEFPNPGRLLARGVKRTATARGDIVDERVSPGTSIFDAVASPAQASQPLGTDNPGQSTGSRSVPEQGGAEEAQALEPDPPKPQPPSGQTVLIAPAARGSNVLQVGGNDGFAPGDLVRVNPGGPNQEDRRLAGLGSLILCDGLAAEHQAGEAVVKLDVGGKTPCSPTATPTDTSSSPPTGTPTPTATGTVTATSTGTVTATPTSTGSATPTATVTATPSVTPTFTATATFTATVTATATPMPPSLSISDASVTEGNAGPVNAVFTVTLSGPTTQVVTVQFQTADNTATLADNDYVPIPPGSTNTLTFTPGGPLTQTVTVQVNGDTRLEANDTFFLDLSAPVNATIARGRGIGIIVDDDTPSVGPATITVSSPLDTDARDTVLTLREAIRVATGALLFANLTLDEQQQVTLGQGGAAVADTIRFAGGLAPIALGAPLPGLSTGGDVVEGGGSVTLTGTGGIGCLTLNSNGNAIRGLTIRACGTAINVVSGSANTIGGAGSVSDRNVLGGNATTGIAVQAAASGTVIQGNVIGANAIGTAADPNGVGISISGTTTTVGGTAGLTPGGACTGACNLISGNTIDGVAVVGTGATGTAIQGNLIGTTLSGASAIGNGVGIRIADAPGVAVGVTIFGAAPGAGNVISGSGTHGVLVEGTNATGTTIKGNRIGTNAGGSAALGNGRSGVLVQNGAPNTVVGGTTPAERNVVSGNGPDPFGGGVIIGATGLPAGTGTVVQGNYIGTNAAGTAALANTNFGVLVFGAPVTVGGTTGVTVGGNCTGACNLISGSGADGIQISGTNVAGTTVQGNYIGTDVTGTAARANNIGVTIGDGNGAIIGGASPQARNIIAGNASHGVILVRASSNSVRGNYIGVDRTGATALPNGANGVAVFESGDTNTIGGTTAAERNVISGNREDGVRLDNTIGIVSGATMTDNVVQGNYIGLNAAGTAAVPNLRDGVAIVEAETTTVGGTTGVTPGGNCTGACNVISGNSGSGVSISGGASSDNTVLGNYIGTDVTGTIDRGNGGRGVLIADAPDTKVGGDTPQARNVISGNAGEGVRIESAGATATATNALVIGNYIGLDTGGTNALINPIGVIINSASNNTIGGTTAGERNVISGNVIGVSILGGALASGNVVQGNYLGVDASGTTAVPTTSDNVFINGANGNTIGGTAGVTPGGPCTGACNLITNSAANGVRLSGGAGNVILGNSVFLNGGQGIARISGANPGVTQPTLFSASTTSASGTAACNNPAGCAVEVFIAQVDGSGPEGKTLVGRGTVTIGTGSPFNIPVTGVSSGDQITATLTDTNGTSQFATAVTVP